VTGVRVVTLDFPATFTRTRYWVPQVRRPMVTSVSVVETMIGAAPAALIASATTTARKPELSDVHLRNACGIPVDGEVRDSHRLRAEVAVVRPPDSSGKAAPQIESPQNRHLDLLVRSQLSCKAQHLSKPGGLQRKQLKADEPPGVNSAYRQPSSLRRIRRPRRTGEGLT
jgi:hypothetical protein